MHTQDLAEWLGLATSTIRLWSRGEFKPYLSPSSQGGQGRTRFFTDTDARIVAHIAKMKSEAVPPKEIHRALKQLQADDWQDLPPMPASRITDGPIPTIPREAADTAIAEQRRGMLREVAMLQDKVADLEQRLETERQDREAIQAELMQTKEELGELRGKLSERRSAAYWLRIVVAVAVVVAIAVIVIALALRT